jgi:hypothetical protein
MPTKAQRDRARERGFCTCCTYRPALPGLKECRGCKDSKAASNKKVMPAIRAKYVEQGRCRACSRPLFGQTTTNCMCCNGRRQERRLNNW